MLQQPMGCRELLQARLFVNCNLVATCDIASATAGLMDDELATRTGEDFYLGVPVLGLKENVLKIQAAIAAPNHYATTQNRSVLVPAVPESFSYDLDGNLLSDGLWIYEWDADGARQRGDGAPKARPQGCRVRVPLGWTGQQNRLIAQELRSDVSEATWKRLEYKYDREGWRVQKLVKTRSTVGGSWTTASDTRFLYDGWNLIAEYSYTGSTFTLLRSHVWGLDLSGTPQGAGGVGGLLWTTVAVTSKTYAAAADANGNVIAYVDCADGSLAGKRDYGAFGEAVITTGVAGSLPFGFSSKYEEKESGLYYYGMRFYAPSTGRWPNRDRIEETGGFNLYAFVQNNPVTALDILGNDPVGAWIFDVYKQRNISFAMPGILPIVVVHILNKSSTYSYNDGVGGAMSTANAENMDYHYDSVARVKMKSDRLPLFCWRRYALPTGNTKKQWDLMHRGIDPGDLRFWLGSSMHVDALGGYFEVKFEGGKMHIRNSTGRFRWFDVIDSNPSINDSLHKILMESVTKVGELISGSAFSVEVDWSDDRPGERALQ